MYDYAYMSSNSIHKQADFLYIARIKPRSLQYIISKASLAWIFLRFAVASKFTVKPVTETVVLASPQSNYSNKVVLLFIYFIIIIFNVAICLLPANCFTVSGRMRSSHCCFG